MDTENYDEGGGWRVKEVRGRGRPPKSWDECSVQDVFRVNHLRGKEVLDRRV